MRPGLPQGGCVYEPRQDGYRIIAVIDGSVVVLHPMFGGVTHPGIAGRVVFFVFCLKFPNVDGRMANPLFCFGFELQEVECSFSCEFDARVPPGCSFCVSPVCNANHMKHARSSMQLVFYG